jgi:hypothetical protein
VISADFFISPTDCRDHCEKRTMNDEQIRTCIAVLKAFTAGELSLDNGILEDLENAISDAYNQGMIDHFDVDCPDDDPGFDPMFLM